MINIDNISELNLGKGFGFCDVKLVIAFFDFPHRQTQIKGLSLQFTKAA